jgi:hypothetical protein
MLAAAVAVALGLPQDQAAQAAAVLVAFHRPQQLMEPQILAAVVEAVAQIMFIQPLIMEALAVLASSSSNTKSPQQLLYLPSNPRRSG